MGWMVQGVWHSDDRRRFDENGRYIAWDTSSVRHWVGEPDFPAVTGRYHLYVMELCPWAHRAWLTRSLKRLEGVVPISFCVPEMTEEGWVFDRTRARYRDRVGDRSALHEVYTEGAPGYSGRVTVPMLLDTWTRRMVNNESADIIRMFDGAFDGLAEPTPKLVPEALLDEITAINERIDAGLSMGVYKAAFATDPHAHAAAVDQVFSTLAWMDDRLAGQRYLAGDQITEADVRAFPTLVRFDAAYHSVCACDRARIVDYEHLWAYTRDLYQHPEFAETVCEPEAYRRGYASIPFALRYGKPLPPVPEIDFSRPHHRARLVDSQ